MKYNAYLIKKGKSWKVNAVTGTEKEVLKDVDAWVMEQLTNSGVVTNVLRSEPTENESVSEAVKELCEKYKPKPKPKPKSKPEPKPEPTKPEKLFQNKKIDE